MLTTKSERTTASAGAYYRALGPLEVLREGRPLSLGGPKQRAVLGVLLLDAGRVVSTDRLLSNVWGGQPPTQVMSSLHAYVSKLRALLADTADPTIIRRVPGYLLDVSPQHIDITHFLDAADQARIAAHGADWTAAQQWARRALKLWRGPLLTDLQNEDWVRPAATALDERRAECTDHLVTALLGCDLPHQAASLARGLYDAHPLQQRPCLLYITALHRAGRTPEALQIYRTYTARLDNELGLEPGPALRDLQVAILRQAPHLLDWPNRSPHPTSTPAGLGPPIRSRQASRRATPVYCGYPTNRHRAGQHSTS